MELVRDGGVEAQHGFDHRIVGGGPGRLATMQFQPLRPEDDAVAGGVGIADSRSVEHERRALELGWQAAHAGLTQRPIEDGGWLTPGLGDFERTAELADQQLRIIDLDSGQNDWQLELQRGRALELEAGAAAAHLDAERIAGDRLGGAVLQATGLPLGRTPGSDLRLRASGGIEPQRGPRDRKQHHQPERNKQRPEPAAGGSREETGMGHLWRS